MNKITSIADFDSAKILDRTNFSTEQVEGFKYSLLFRHGELLSANFNSLVNKLAADGIPESGQIDFVITTLKSFGIDIDEETFLRRYNHIFFGDVNTCQCKYAPGWYCNCC